MNTQKTPLTHEQKAKTFAFLFATVIAIIAFFYIRSCSNEKPVHDKNSALVSSESFVEDKIATPSTAKFGSDYTDGVKQLNDSTFEVTNTVDYQNEFSAMVRHNYSCTITYSGDKIKCKDLVIE